MGLVTGVFNLFRILGDASHTFSKIFLIWAIHWNRSAEGVSLITQVLYAIVFVTRYLDLFYVAPFYSFVHFWLFCFKVFYLTSSLYIIFLMTSVYARTREREKAWKFGTYCLAGALLLAIPVCALFQEGPVVHVVVDEVKDTAHMYSHPFRFTEILWTFSIILESTAILPQLLLLRQTAVPTVLDSYYLLTLGSYRAFYILNWIVRVADPAEHHFDSIAFSFGVIQTALYVDFAWVYYTRQRVKLRAGGVVDDQDLNRGWLVGRLARKAQADEENLDGEGDGRLTLDGSGRRSQNANANATRWGRRGISVSADEGLRDEDQRPLTDPGQFEDFSEEEDAVEVEVPKGGDSSASTRQADVDDENEPGQHVVEQEPIHNEWADSRSDP